MIKSCLMFPGRCCSGAGSQITQILGCAAKLQRGQATGAGAQKQNAKHPANTS